MDLKEFTGGGGKIVFTRDDEYGEYYTFEPNFLPIKIDSGTPPLSRLLEHAALQLGQLSGIANKEMTTTTFLSYSQKRKEAVSSSNIEGTNSSLNNIVIAEAKKTLEGQAPTGDDLEVMNHANALEEGITYIGTQELSANLILKLHKTLLSGDVRGNIAKPGEFRDGANYIKPLDLIIGNKILDSPYVPPRAVLISEYLDNLFGYLNDDTDEESKLIKIALGHYQFESIHPFWDGNGRIGRLLMTLYLMKKQILSVPLLSLSIYFERERERYIKLLLHANQKGDYYPWVKFFLEGIIAQAKDTIDTESKLIAYRDKIKDILLKEGTATSTRAFTIFESLLKRPFISIPEAKTTLDVSYPTANEAIERLINLKVLQEITGKPSYKVYVASEIVNLVSTSNTKSTKPISSPTPGESKPFTTGR